MIQRQRIETVANLQGPGRVETLQGTEYRVVPATLVRSQVLVNNVGRCYLPPDAFTPEWANAANGAPVVTDHPTKNGREISARHPEILNSMGVGWLFDVRAEGEELVGEVWLNEGRAEEVEELAVILERLVENEEDVELSTGFAAFGERRKGVANGKQYDFVIYPDGFDHLATFAQKKGACSVEDGCGLHANQAGEPNFQGTEDVSPEWADGDWGRPALSDHPEVGENETWENLDAAEREQIAARFVVGSADAETYGDLAYPVVNPSTGRLNRNGVLAARQRASAQGDDEVSGVVDALWEEHFAEEEEDGESGTANNEEVANEGALRRVWMQLQSLFGNQAEFSLDDRREKVRDAARAAFGGPNTFVWVEELFEESVVIGIEAAGGETVFQRVDYETDEAARTVTLGTETQEVERVEEFVPVNGRIEVRYEYLATDPQEETQMKRKQLIERLCGCENVVFGKETLEKMTDQELAHVANQADIEVEAEGGSGEGAGEGAGGSGGSATAVAEPPEEGAGEEEEEVPAWAKGIQESVSTLADEVSTLKEETSPVREQAQQERGRLVEEITANSEFSEEELKGKPLTELRKLHAMSERKAKTYVGLGFPQKDSGRKSGDDLGFRVHSTMGAGPGEPVDAEETEAN